MTKNPELQRWTEDVLPGWEPLVKLGWAAVTANGYTITQVKEKFGELRIYFYNPAPASESEEIETPETMATARERYKAVLDFVDALGTLSTTVCEFCGAPGKLRQVGWWKTTCDECQQARETEGQVEAVPRWER